jgi:hypothetical protein
MTKWLASYVFAQLRIKNLKTFRLELETCLVVFYIFFDAPGFQGSFGKQAK